jgi:hypothetical protein
MRAAQERRHAAHAGAMRSIERHGAQAAPLVRDEVARRGSSSRSIT